MTSLHSLFLKPSLACTAKCGHCESRRAFYRKRDGRALTIEQYRSIIREAKSLGARSLHISGGEPTLYPRLADLVSEGARLNMFTVLNTNGSLMDRSLAERLLAAGLRSVIISIHSHRKHVHDSIRCRKGNFDEVMNAITVLGELRDTSYPDFHISTQTIVTTSNYRDLAGIVGLACSMNVDAHGFSYVEGDFDLERTPGIEDIAVLRKIVIPDVIARLKKHHFTNVLLKLAAIRLISGLYGGSPGRQHRLSRGIYLEKDGNVNCRTPRGFAMVLADGSVLPCNMVEYTDGPIIGNVHEDTMSEIIQSDDWKDFARHGYEYCRFCPTHFHFHIPISTSLKKILPLVLNNPAFEQKSILGRLREAL